MNNAGLTVYKTPEQWIEENPEIAKSISPREEVKTFFGDGYYYYKLNQRLNWEIHKRRLPMGLVYENTDKIIDSKNNEVLVVQTDYDTNINNPYIGNADFRDYKIWLWLPTCSRGNSESKWHFNAKNFSEYLNKYKNLKSSN
jgi:hypothetical protein